MPSVNIDAEKCSGCTTCEELCPMDVFEMKDSKATVAKENACIGCRACEAQCPEHCITISE